ncbi:related to thioredoxin reductase [Ramularia collo-cygni]|uniref:Related to thioredoxin reductase n=1 Tax=Ramularia collo-cygni TaxID=112498 RepID=A0A2D3V6T5_9PEZI|nr:related to thioredoxin reductase [Ramularia collo-cygni]CZT23693.1 related to thioredoxin reductase [Ramularia collo-cygni]
MSDKFDVLILGGGLGGLSAALSLVRTLHTAVVFDSHTYRNRKANWLHTIPGFDGKDPEDYRAAARQNILAKYSTCQFANGVKIDHVARNEDSEYAFTATDADGRLWHGKKLILAMGIQDVPMDIPGYDDCWTKSIFHCLVHRGYEERGCGSAGVLAAGGDDNLKAARHLSLQCRRYTDGPVTVYTHGNDALAAECARELGPLGFHIESRSVASFRRLGQQSQLAITLEDGTVKEEGFLIHRPLPSNNGRFAAQLGVETNEQGFYNTRPPFFETTVPGCFAAGDCADPFKIGTFAIAMGAFVAGGVQMQLDAGTAETAGPAYQKVKPSEEELVEEKHDSGAEDVVAKA